MLKTSLHTNIIPHIWKLANIVPIPKPNKDIDQETSYRPISLLSVITVSGEEHYSVHNSKHTKHTHAIRVQNRTLVMALHTVNNTVAKGFNQMAPLARTFIVALVMSTINIHTLIRKLLQTNIPGTLIKLIAIYIKRRKTYINHTSSQRQFKTGVPQGGILPPTLFTIYNADIPPPRSSV